MDVKGAVAIVTGGTGGLGQRICFKLAEAGTHVMLVYVQSADAAKQLADTLSALGTRASAVQADITTQQGVDKMIAKTSEAFGHVDILVNDAAYNRWIPFKDLEGLTEEVWSHMIHFNLTAPFLAMRSIAPVLKSNGRGRIVNIASNAGLIPTGSSMAYSVSKAALIHLTRCMAVALAPEILVNCVAPGLMEGTRMTANLSPEFAEAARRSTLLSRAVERDDVADAVLTFIRTDSITGQTLVVDTGKVFH